MTHGTFNPGGWVKVHRATADHPIFAGRPDRLGAWVWLLMRAAWKPTRQDVNGRTIVVQRGQFSTSFRELASAWGWSVGAVQRYMTRLKTETMIETRTDTGRLLLTICDYNKYQSYTSAGDTPTDTPAIQERYTKEEGKKERTLRIPPPGGVGGRDRIDAPPSLHLVPSEERRAPDHLAERFEEFWSVYPKHVEKKKAREKFDQIVRRKEATPEEIIAGAKRYAALRQREVETSRRPDEARYTAGPVPWLNGARWQDEAPPPPPTRPEHDILARINLNDRALRLGPLPAVRS